MKKLFVIGPIIFFFVIIISYLSVVNFTDRNEVGIAYNRVTGDLWLQNTGGWKLTSPVVSVVRIDVRPVRVCITTVARAFNCKLVQFEPKAYEVFVETEGFRYYWWANRFSFNFGYKEEYRGMRDIIRGYAFSAKKYPFLKVVNDYVDQP